jgi:hypothetical protein
MQKADYIKGISIALLIVLAAVSRLIPHPWNFTPMIAIMIFAAAYIKNPLYKIVFPFAVIVLSDVFLEITNGFGFHNGTPVVYASYLIVAAFSYFTMTKVNALRIFGTSLFASIIFFLITNFALFYPAASSVNLELGYYPHNISGVMASYTAALPFFRNSVFGDALFAGILFGIYAIINKLISSSVLVSKA